MAYFYVIFTFLLGITQSLHIPSPRVDPFLNIQKITFPYHRDDATFDYGFYGVVIKFSENAQGIFARDEQVAGLALQAYEEARAVKENEINLSGMAVLLVGDEAYFASPMGRIGKPGNADVPNLPRISFTMFLGAMNHYGSS